MSFTENLTNSIKAGYCYFYCQTYEIAKASDEISDAVKQLEGYEPTIWDFNTQPDLDQVIADFEKNINAARPVLIAKNLNWFMKDEYGSFNKELVSMLQSKAEYFSSTNGRRVLVIVSDADFNDAIPAPLQKDFNILDFELPDKVEIKKQYDFIVASVKQGKPGWKAPTKKVEAEIILSCRGMTTREIQNALAFSLVKDGGKLNPKTLAQIRAKGIEKVAGIKTGDYNTDFKSLLGYENIKEFTGKTVRSKLAKGIMLLGPPGTGKTHFCHCLGKESGLEVFELEVAQLMGSLVGESEAKMKAALEIVAANVPCILFVDEVDKALAGVGGGGQAGDGGTTKRSMAQFLKFLSDGRPEGLYVVATCNDIKALPPEWIRAERWDAVFFIDLPNEIERNAIFEFYLDKFKVKPGKLESSGLVGFAGAELKSICRIAAMMDKRCDQVQQFIIPVSKTMGSEIDSLRKWAKDRTIPASTSVPENGDKPNLREIGV